MAENPSDLSLKKDNLYKELIDFYIKGVETGLFSSEEDSKESARFILDKLESIALEHEIKPFLEELAAKWPAYKSILVPLKIEGYQEKDQQQIDVVENELEKLAAGIPQGQ